MNEMKVFLDRIKVHFRHHVIKKGKEAPFWIALSFMITFAIVRYITYSIRRSKQQAARHPQAQQHHSKLGFHDITIGGGIHLHHMVPGIILTLVAGYLGLVAGEKIKKPVSIMYGTGAALALDEFALWLELRDVYWAKDGHKSVDAVGIAATVFVGGFALAEFGGAILRDIRHRMTTGTYPPHHVELDDLPPDVEYPSGTLVPPEAASVAADNGQVTATRQRTRH
jgi:hypothetical protein